MKLIRNFIIMSVLVLCPGISLADTSLMTTEPLKHDDPAALTNLQAFAGQSSDTNIVTGEPSAGLPKDSAEVSMREAAPQSGMDIQKEEAVTLSAQNTLTNEKEIKTAAPAGNMDGYEETEKETPHIADPIAPVNKAMFHFNDKLYFWLLKPVTQVYSYIVPEAFRFVFSNVYDNLRAPARMLNNLFQLRLKASGNELIRFVVNSVVGIGGLEDAAKDVLEIKKQDADFGQTLGHYGIGHGFYLVLPVLGPSSLRDGIGIVGDHFMYPLTYVSSSDINFVESAAIYTHEKVNDTSFKIGDYESFKESSVDPYVSMRDAFVQHRKNKVEESKK